MGREVSDMGGFLFGWPRLAQGLDHGDLVAAALAVAGGRRRPHAAPQFPNLPVYGDVPGEQVVLRISDLDFLVEFVPGSPLPPTAGIDIRQGRLSAQAAFAPEREGLRHHDRVRAEDAGVFVILVGVADGRVVEPAGTCGLGRGRFGVQGGGPQRRAQASAGGQQTVGRRTQRSVCPHQRSVCRDKRNIWGSGHGGRVDEQTGCQHDASTEPL